MSSSLIVILKLAIISDVSALVFVDCELSAASWTPVDSDLSISEKSNGDQIWETTTLEHLSASHESSYFPDHHTPRRVATRAAIDIDSLCLPESPNLQIDCQSVLPVLSRSRCDVFVQFREYFSFFRPAFGCGLARSDLQIVGEKDNMREMGLICFWV